LHEQAGRWARAAETLEKVARVAREPAARTEALVRAAALALERFDDRVTAESRYVRALDLDADNLGALGALGALYRRQGDLLRAAKLMREAEARTTNRIDKARLLYDLGTLYQDGLGTPGRPPSFWAARSTSTPSTSSRPSASRRSTSGRSAGPRSSPCSRC